MENDKTSGGPEAPSFLTLVLKTFAGLGGGICGMLVLLVIFLGASTILQPAIAPDVSIEDGTGKSPLFIFVFMAMIFLTSLAANILGSLFFTFVERERYSRASTALYQIFFANMVIFGLLAPIYILLDSQNALSMIGFLAGFHVLISALASVLVLEIIGNLRYALVGVYGVVFSVVISTAVVMGLYYFTQNNPVVVLFTALPLMWVSLGFVTVITEMFYHWLWTIYGTDFLMSTQKFGADYAEEEPEEAPPPPDVEGAEFLKKR